MANFSIKEKETKIVGTATFDKASDYKVVELKDGSQHLLHKVHADKLINKKLATLVKDAKIKEGTPEITTTVIEK